MPQVKRNPHPEDGIWLGGYMDKEIVALFDADWYRVCGEARTQGKPAPTRLQHLAELIRKTLTRDKS